MGRLLESSYFMHLGKFDSLKFLTMALDLCKSFVLMCEKVKTFSINKDMSFLCIYTWERQNFQKYCSSVGCICNCPSQFWRLASEDSGCLLQYSRWPNVMLGTRNCQPQKYARKHFVFWQLSLWAQSICSQLCGSCNCPCGPECLSLWTHAMIAYFTVWSYQ